MSTLARRRWAVPASAKALAALVLLVAGSVSWLWLTPSGRATRYSPTVIIALAELQGVWAQRTESTGPPAAGEGALVGRVVTPPDRPAAPAVALVADRQGRVLAGTVGADGRFELTGVPQGTYVPAAVVAGFDPVPAPAARVRPGQPNHAGTLSMARHAPRRVAVQSAPAFSRPERVFAFWPQYAAAERATFTFWRDWTVVRGFVYEPEGRGRLPALVISYPGPPLWWDGVSVELAGLGYGVVALGPTKGFDVTGTLDDLLSTVAQLRRGALSPRLDPGRYALVGGSYGTLITFLAARELPDARAHISYGGVTDAFLIYRDVLLGIFSPPYPFGPVVRYGLGRPDRDSARFLYYSPAFRAAEQPPTLLIHGTADRWVPPNQSERLAEALAAAGRPYELYLYPGVEHYLIPEERDPATEDMYHRTAVFLARYLGN